MKECRIAVKHPLALLRRVALPFQMVLTLSLSFNIRTRALVGNIEAVVFELIRP